MPTLQQVQDTILSAQLEMANLIESDRLRMVTGCNPKDKGQINRFYYNILSLIYQAYNREDLTSAKTLAFYDCLNTLIGIDTTVNTLDPNFQSDDITIEIINPAAYLSPMDINWSQFSADGEVDGGRNTYRNTALAGINPFMQDAVTTLLTLGVDYTLIPSGGFVLSQTGNLPYIYEGSFLRAYNYALTTI